MNGRPDNGLFKVSIIVVLCAYMMLGQMMLPSGIGWNPQFNLKTFAQKPSESTRYALRFTQIDGMELAAPLYFSDAAELLSDEDIHEGKRMITRLGISLHDNDQSLVHEYRLVLENTYFQTFASATYEIVFIDIAPVEKYSLETFISERIVSEFSHPLADSTAFDLFEYNPSTN